VVPTLEEVLELVMGWPGGERRILIELKGPFGGLPALLGSVLRRTGVLHHEAPVYSELPAVLAAALKPYKAAVDSGRVLVQSFYMPYLKELHKLMSGLPLLYLTLSATSGWLEREHVLETAVHNGLVGISARNTFLSADTVARLHSLGLLVFAWTVDEPEVMVQAKGKGVDGLITNCPGVAMAALAATCATVAPELSKSPKAASPRSRRSMGLVSAGAGAIAAVGGALVVRKRSNSVIVL